MKRHAPATERNRDPILAVLREELPARGLVLEIASGTGEHAVFFAARFPALVWQPSDASSSALESIAAWREESGLTNLRSPRRLDVTASPWPIDHADAVFCANMLHIAPWTACEGLMAGASSVLPPGGPLVVYGPFLREGVPTAESNLAFDADLRARNPEWGVRSLDRVSAVARQNGLGLERVVELPSNNVAAVWRRS